jgi:hypothetical protein
MTERRPLVEGLKPRPGASRAVEEDFVYADKAKHPASSPKPSATADHGRSKAKPAAGRVPLTTRLRADLAAALKRASLERQLAGIEPNHVQVILEEALEPWLRDNGYLR